MLGSIDPATEENLLEACKTGQLDTVQSLIEKIRGNQVTEEARLPLYERAMVAASRHDRSEVIKYFLSNDGRMTSKVINAAAVSHAWNTHRVLVLSGGLDINYEVEWLGGFLILATEQNNLDAVRFCLTHGANPNLHRVQDTMKSIALAADSPTASVELATLLIDHGAVVPGSGAIVLAAATGKTDMAALLLDHGTDINEIGVKDYGDDRMDEDMGTPLHKAIENRHVHMIRFLLSRGADAERPDSQGRTPLQLARQLGHKAEVGILEAHLAGGDALSGTG